MRQPSATTLFRVGFQLKQPHCRWSNNGKLSRARFLFQKKEQKKVRSPPQKQKGEAISKIPLLDLTECGARYMLAAAYPFSAEALGACVPVFPSRPSQKIGAKKSGIFTTSAISGDGYIAVAPCLASDLFSVYTTNSEFKEEVVALDSVTSSTAPSQLGVDKHKQHGTGRGYADLSNEGKAWDASYTGRMVSVGVRVRCISAHDRVGGLMYMVADGMHSNLNGYTATELRNHPDCIRMPITTEWNTVSIAAVSPQEVNFPEHGAYENGNDINMKRLFPFCSNQSIVEIYSTGGIPLVIWVSGEVGAKYEFEVVQHCELVGREMLPGLLTASHIDETAFQATQVGLRRSVTQRSHKPSTDGGQSVLQHANYYLGEAGSIARSGTKLIKSAITAYGDLSALAAAASPLLLT